MKTSAISQRVADFLKQHPPFEFMEEEDLLQLAWRGRVKFHESDEFVYWQGKTPAQFVFVIQQGAVALMEERDDGERLRDIRGAGDMLGVDRFFGAETWPHSAKTTSERFRAAAPATPEERTLFEEADGALQVALYHQAREGIRRSSDGTVLDHATLSRYDQQLLKRSFRSILRLLEYASRAFTLEGL